MVEWWTHKIQNVHKNDVIMAATTDDMYRMMCTVRGKRVLKRTDNRRSFLATRFLREEQGGVGQAF